MNRDEVHRLAAAADLASVQLPARAARPLLRAAAAAAGPDATVLGPAHVSLGYPWRTVPDPDRVTATARRSPAMRTTLGAPARFPPDEHDQEVLYLPVGDPAPVRRLAGDLGWDGEDLLPHCSVVRARSSQPLDRAEEALRRLTPLPVVLDVVEIRVRVRGRWHVVLHEPLASSATTSGA